MVIGHNHSPYFLALLLVHAAVWGTLHARVHHDRLHIQGDLILLEWSGRRLLSCITFTAPLLFRHKHLLRSPQCPCAVCVSLGLTSSTGQPKSGIGCAFQLCVQTLWDISKMHPRAHCIMGLCCLFSTGQPMRSLFLCSYIVAIMGQRKADSLLSDWGWTTKT